MIRVKDLFDIKYGVNLELNKLIQCSENSSNAINFVSRTSKNNGVSAIVERVAGVEPLPAGTISVAGGGSVMESFLQPNEYYSGRDLFCLTPLVPLTEVQKIFYCLCLRANKYRYNYGRQANRTIGDILIPEVDSLPSWLDNVFVTDYSDISKSISNKRISLNISDWKNFEYNEIFRITRGESIYLQDMDEGIYPYVSASADNNGITAYVDRYNHDGNKITLSYDGSVGEAYYQPDKFFASEKIAVLDLKKGVLNEYVAHFIITLIRQEKFRYNYGLKWSINSRMLNSTIKLPVKLNGKLDLDFMERYIKSLPYSKFI